VAASGSRMSGSDASDPSRGILAPACGLTEPVIPNVHAEQAAAAAAALQKLTDEQFVRVVEPTSSDRRNPPENPNSRMARSRTPNKSSGKMDNMVRIWSGMIRDLCTCTDPFSLRMPFNVSSTSALLVGDACPANSGHGTDAMRVHYSTGVIDDPVTLSRPQQTGELGTGSWEVGIGQERAVGV